MKDLKSLLKEIKSLTDKYFNESFNSGSNELESTTEAMNYMVNLGDGGKRIRPTIVMAVVYGFNGNRELGWLFANAVELMHTYTLIIDDIQDNGSVRRGLPTCHVQFGFNTAILAASRLFERGTYPFHKYCANVQQFTDLNDQLHRGQAADLNSETWDNQKKNIENLQFIHSGKTSSLIQMSILGGCIASNLNEFQTESLIRYGYYAGLAFQAQDDILSQTVSTEQLGKLAGIDADVNKLTYPNLYGSVEKASEAAIGLASLAKDELKEFNKDQIRILYELADYAVYRKS